jgi:signal transduction histidine kinase/CheY-like chemotaxis protein
VEDPERGLAVGPAEGFAGTEGVVQSLGLGHEPDPERALERVSGGAGCVILAADLPERDVPSYIERLREAEPDLSVVYCSDGRERTEAALDAGATEVVAADADERILRHRLGQLCEGNRSSETYRRQIESLHGIGVELAACETQQEVYDLAVTAGEEVLDLDICAIGVVEDGKFQLRASTDALPEEGYHEPEVDAPHGGHAAKVYRTGEAILTDDMQESPDANPLLDYRGAMTVPIGEFGVFQAVSYEIGAFDRTDLELSEILVGHVREALARLEQTARLERSREELARENERLDEFTSIVSHDLRNPLNVATLQLELLSEDVEHDRLDAAREALERTETLINDLLSLAREGEAVSEFDAVRLDRSARRAWQHVDTGAADIDVRTEVTVEADESRLRQLLSNLFRNAVEHGSTGSRAQSDDAVEHGSADPDGEGLTVTVGETADGFFVADDGDGLPSEIRDEMFESGVTDGADSTGLGLAIVKRIAEAHGWDLRATDSEVGGARFEFTGVDTVEEG